MPKKSRSYSFNSRCSRDRYYEWLEQRREWEEARINSYGDCYCHDLMCDREGEELPCGYCRHEDALDNTSEAAVAPHPHQDAMGFIRQKLTAVAAAGGVEARLPIIKELFEGLLGCQAFLTAYPKMRTAVEKKAAEFRADERAAELIPLLDQVTAMLKAL
jgi:hypothetical protein